VFFSEKIIMKLVDGSYTRIFINRLFVIGLLFFVATPTFAQGLDNGAQNLENSLVGYGVVLLHGRQSTPALFAKLSGALKAQGAIVLTPNMSWSYWRIYDASWEKQIKEIETAIGQARALGARQVVLGGQGIGAGAALAYATRHSDIASLIIMAPSVGINLSEEQLADYRDIDNEIKRAKDLVSNGQGDVPTVLLDINTPGPKPTTRFFVTSTPKIYLDYHGTSTKVSHADVNYSKISVEINSAKIPHIPVFWINANKDDYVPSQRTAAKLIPKNLHNHYLEIDGYGFDVPDDSRYAIVDWLKSLKQR